MAHWGIMKELLWLISKEGGDELDHWRGDVVAHWGIIMGAIVTHQRIRREMFWLTVGEMWWH